MIRCFQRTRAGLCTAQMEAASTMAYLWQVGSSVSQVLCRLSVVAVVSAQILSMLYRIWRGSQYLPACPSKVIQRRPSVTLSELCVLMTAWVLWFFVKAERFVFLEGLLLPPWVVSGVRHASVIDIFVNLPKWLWMCSSKLHSVLPWPKKEHLKEHMRFVICQ